MDKEKAFQLIWVSIVLGGFLTIVYLKNSHMDLVKKNLKVTIGRVYEAKGYKGGVSVNVVFVVNGKGYTTGKTIYNEYNLVNKFKNTRWDVAYDSLNPGHNELLVKPDDYKKYNLEYPSPFLEVHGFVVDSL